MLTLYIVLVLCFVVLLGVVAAVYMLVKKHMRQKAHHAATPVGPEQENP